MLHQDNDKLHMNLLELEVSGDPWASAEAVQECVTRALAAPLTPDTKILFSQRGLQFAEDYSNSIQRSEVNSRLTGRYRTSSVSCKPFIDFFLSLAVCLSVSVLGSVLSVYDEHQKLLQELGGTKRGAENG